MSILKWWEVFKAFSVRFTQPHKRNRFLRYAFPVVILGILVLIDIYLSDFRQQAPLLLLTFVIILSAWFGGFGPGLWATFLAACVGNYFFIEPHFTFVGAEGVTIMIIFIVEGVVISLISEAKRQTDRQKDNFIGFASHELKNPLAAIQGNAQLLHKTFKKLSKPRVIAISKSIDEQAKRATYLINELLDIAKIESGKLNYDKEVFSFYSFVETLVKEQRLVYTTHKIILRGKVRKRVYGDKYRIGQVIVNLISNGVKYSPDAKQLVVSLSTQSGSVIVSVQDFGKGIAKENISRVFDAYFREGSASFGGTQGLGLGLFISAEIIRHHKGKIWLTSTEGKGSTFYFSLPYN